jgi:hypothetical protein
VAGLCCGDDEEIDVARLPKIENCEFCEFFDSPYREN